MALDQRDAAERFLEEVQQQFSARVLRPQIAELELERIVQVTVNHYVERLRIELAAIPERYQLPVADWERYLAGLAVTTMDTEGGREVPLTLKALTASAAGGTVMLAARLQPMMAKATGTALTTASNPLVKQLANSGAAKLAGNASGKFLGIFVGVGILVWDLWDHHQTEQEYRPRLRQSIADYFEVMKQVLVDDPEEGVMFTFHDLEGQLLKRISSL